MAEVQQALEGHVMVFGPPDATLNNGSGTSLGVLLTNVNESKSAQRLKTPNAAGETVNVTTFNQNITVTCTCRAVANNRADAITKVLLMPNPGDVVKAVTKGSPTTWTSSDFSAESTGKPWSVVSATRTGSSGAHVDYELVLEREGAIADAGYTPV